MKSLHIIIMGVLIPMFILGDTGGGGVSWFSAPKAVPNGWYWMYDDEEEGPPFTDPIIAPIEDVGFVDITTTGTKIAPQDNIPFFYELPDSFWYYGIWYEPGDTLYISPDGWVSFDPAASSGFPDPPSGMEFPITDDPNALIAPLWQDHDPTRDPGDVSNNRVYYLYDPTAQTLIVEWYQIEARTSGNSYTFELMLDLGGQYRLVEHGSCGVVFSYHFIHLLYEDASAGWNADNGATGIENHTGTLGIDYQGALIDGRVIRAGYKKIFKHDMTPVAFLSPGPMVLRYTPVELVAVIENAGQETEHYALTIDIFDDEGDRVYNRNLGAFDLLPGFRDTVAADSCWEPFEIGQYYDLVLFTMLSRDECGHNDTLIARTFVHCDDTLRYDWNFADHGKGYGVEDTCLGTFYAVDNGVLVTGGRVYISPYVGENYVPPALEVWSATNGCGAAAASGPLVYAQCDSNQTGWNQANFSYSGVWIPSAQPGNIWVAATSSSETEPSGLFSAFAQRTWAGSSTCYTGSGPGRGGYWQSAGASGFNWGFYSGDFYTVPIELFAHLGFGAYPLPAAPSPPCYDGGIHDLTCFSVLSQIEYVEAGVPITTEIAIANIGRQTEPDASVFPAKFMAVDKEGVLEYENDTVFTDSFMVDHIGWLGDDTDDPDTLVVQMNLWAPEGRCADIWDDGPFVQYELIGLVHLGEVGPDSSDHCPYNDTIRRGVTCLLSHDVGVIDIYWPEEPDEPPDHYEPGRTLTITATVENFGYHMEHDIPVRCEIFDRDGDTLVYNNVQLISALDWRGNPLENPYTTDVVFPTWTIPSDNRFSFECRTEMEGDECPDDDFEVTYLDPVEEAKIAPRVFRLEVPGTMTEDNCSIQFAVPYSSWVKLDVFDVDGRWVKTLANDLCKPGYYNRTWDGKDAAGRKVATGIYLVRMEAGEFSDVQKIVLLY